MASSEEKDNGGEPSSALLSKLGGSLFGAVKGSPHKVVTNVKGFIADRISGAIPDPGMSPIRNWIQKILKNDSKVSLIAFVWQNSFKYTTFCNKTTFH